MPVLLQKDWRMGSTGDAMICADSMNELHHLGRPIGDSVSLCLGLHSSCTCIRRISELPMESELTLLNCDAHEVGP